MKSLLLLLLSALLLAAPADCRTRKYYQHHRENRSRAVTQQFQREHPCPSTGKKYGRCPGYIKDHVVALCAGGADSPSNMQWQSTADAKAKDKTECGAVGRKSR